MDRVKTTFLLEVNDVINPFLEIDYTGRAS